MKTFKQRKIELKELSRKLKPLIKEGVYSKMNEALIAHYKEKNNLSELNTYHGWKSKGFKPKRGQDYFLIWAKPITIDHPNSSTNEDEMEFFPVAFMYSSDQVEPLPKKEATA